MTRIWGGRAVCSCVIDAPDEAAAKDVLRGLVDPDTGLDVMWSVFEVDSLGAIPVGWGNVRPFGGEPGDERTVHERLQPKATWQRTQAARQAVEAARQALAAAIDEVERAYTAEAIADGLDEEHAAEYGLSVATSYANQKPPGWERTPGGGIRRVR